MNKPLIALAGLIFAGGAAGGGFLIASSGGEEEVVQQIETAAPAASASPDTSPTVAPTATAAASPTESADLRPPEDGYTWQQIPTRSDGSPGYAVQVPEDWRTPGLLETPASFAPEGRTEAGPILLVSVTPVAAGFEHPILFNLPMSGTTCGSGVPYGDMPGGPSDAKDAPPSGQFAGDAYTWDVYYFKCETRLTASDVADGRVPVPFDVRGAEVRAGDFIFSVTAFEPTGSAAAQSAFEQALQSFRQR